MRPWCIGRARLVERCLIIVARDQPDLLAQFAFMYAHEPNVEVCFDRRHGRAKHGDGPDRRYPPRPDRDLDAHGFIVIPRA